MSLTRLRFADFTVFQRAEFQLVDGVNVLIGPNGTGKSHVLRSAYALGGALRVWSAAASATGVEQSMREALAGAFGIGRVEQLIRARADALRLRADFKTARRSFALDFRHRSKGVSSATVAGTRQDAKAAVPRPTLIPPHEVLWVEPFYPTVVKDFEIPVDSVVQDLCEALRRPVKRESDAAPTALLREVRKAIGGHLVRKEGRLLFRPEGDTQSMPTALVAEGHRKLASLERLVLNGAIGPRHLVLWDEPEANLNPGLHKTVAAVIFGLAREGVQVMLATHDYQFASELSLLVGAPRTTARFFSLAASPDGVAVTFADKFEGLAVNPILDAATDLHVRELETDG